MSENATYRGGNTIRRFDVKTKKNGDGTEKREGYIWLKVLHTNEMDTVWKNDTLH